MDDSLYFVYDKTDCALRTDIPTQLTAHLYKLLWLRFCSIGHYLCIFEWVRVQAKKTKTTEKWKHVDPKSKPKGMDRRTKTHI